MVIIEFLQKFYGGHGTMLGTYDLYDIICFSIAYFLILLISFWLYKKDNSNIEKSEVIKKEELILNTKIICVFIVLGIMPSLF